MSDIAQSPNNILTRPMAASGVHVTVKHLDIIGDIHGCITELRELLSMLGWREEGTLWSHPEDRLLVLVGDLVNRGPASWEVVEWVWRMRAAGRLVFVVGNHDRMILEALDGSSTQWLSAVSGMIKVLLGMDLARRQAAQEQTIELMRQAPLWASFGASPEKPELVVVHACWHPRIADVPGSKLISTCVYGPVAPCEPGERPRRLDWRLVYPEDAPLCVHGHTAFDGPVKKVRNTLCIDTGCVFGGRLTALRWPEQEIVQVEAKRVYSPYPSIPSAPPLFDPASLPEGGEVRWPWEVEG